MSITAQQIRDALNDPPTLEALYRRDPTAFRRAFAEAAAAAPDSPVIRVWEARLRWDEVPAEPGAAPSGTARDRDPGRRRLWGALGLGLLAGTLIRIPTIWISEDWYYPRYLPTLVLLALAGYFWLERRSREHALTGGVLAVVVAVYALLLPGGPDYTDSVVLALLYLPVLVWALLGIVFAGPRWRDDDARIDFVRYNGELLILASLVGLSFFVFSGITVNLFALIFEDPAEWYAENIGIFGAAAVPLIATYLYDVVFGRRTAIASVLVRIFVPLFLAMTVVYLAVALLGDRNPFLDRSFLLGFNLLLLVVLGMTVFSIAQRERAAGVSWIDYATMGLLVVTFVIDLIALSAIVFRLSSYGFTPNRVVVLGTNLVVLAHLVWIFREYLGVLRGQAEVGVLRRPVAGYLPVYVGWAALVAFVLPLVFRYA
ncbi:MAG: hypothetical protein D6701_07480 [Gemmatimonadetes bacterium]|nr:MAG: hypothetical protein D6701_07480 [Gemmatimonadota bacterium]